MKTTTIFSVGAILAIGLAGVATADFDGPYDPANWTFNNNGGDGSFTNNGIILALTGDNGGAPGGQDTDYTIMAAASGDWTFNWNYSSTDSGDFDSGGYLLNGAYTELADNKNQGSGSVAVAVSFGDTIGYRVFSEDGGIGPGVLTIDRFNAPIPGPAAAALLGIAGLLGKRSRRRRA